MRDKELIAGDHFSPVDNIALHHFNSNFSQLKVVLTSVNYT